METKEELEKRLSGEFVANMTTDFANKMGELVGAQMIGQKSEDYVTGFVEGAAFAMESMSNNIKPIDDIFNLYKDLNELESQEKQSL